MTFIVAASERCSGDGRNTQTRTATCVPHHHHQQVPVCQNTGPWLQNALPPNYVSIDHVTNIHAENTVTTSAIEEARNLSSTLRKNEKAIGKKISRALSTPHLATNNNINHHNERSNDPNQSDSYEEIVLGDKNIANNNYSISYSCNNPINNSGRHNMTRDRIHSFSVSTTTSASSSSSASTAYHENGACCAQLSEQQQKMHHTHVHCQHHHTHRQVRNSNSNSLLLQQIL